MTYRIEFVNQAAKQFRTLPVQIQEQLKTKIDALSTNPRSYGVTKLAGEDDLYRIRSGDYRIIYNIQDRQLLILVVKIGHRRNVYR
jgi:mRNA interferase RelE/StbE